MAGFVEVGITPLRNRNSRSEWMCYRPLERPRPRHRSNQGGAICNRPCFNTAISNRRSLNKCGYLPQRFARFGNKRRPELPSVRHSFEAAQLTRSASGEHLLMQLSRVIQQDFIFADVNQQRWQVREIAEER